MLNQLDYSQSTVFDALARLTERRFSQFEADDCQFFVGMSAFFFFSDIAISVSAKGLRYETVVAALDDLVEMGLIEQKETLYEMQFCIGDILDRLEAHTAKFEDD